MLVCTVIVDDQMQSEIGRCLDVDLLEEPKEFLVAMARHAVADDVPIQHTQCGEQRRRPAP
jgi:hypothetical protein